MRAYASSRGSKERSILQAALERGRGAILLSAHFTTLEIGARTLCARHADEHHVPTDEQSRAGAFPACATADDRQSARSLETTYVCWSTALKANEAVWYAPDQSYRKKGAEMVPFFNIPAATNTATSRLARMTGAAVLPYFPERLPGRRATGCDPAHARELSYRRSGGRCASGSTRSSRRTCGMFRRNTCGFTDGSRALRPIIPTTTARNK